MALPDLSYSVVVTVLASTVPSASKSYSWATRTIRPCLSKFVVTIDR
jgi:hypothetical protein